MNDNLGLLFRTHGILNRFRNAAQLSAHEQKQENSERQTGGDADNKQQTEEQRRYVQTRLRELAAFERKAGGK